MSPGLFSASGLILLDVLIWRKCLWHLVTVTHHYSATALFETLPLKVIFWVITFSIIWDDLSHVLVGVTPEWFSLHWLSHYARNFTGQQCCGVRACVYGSIHMLLLLSVVFQATNELCIQVHTAYRLPVSEISYFLKRVFIIPVYAAPGLVILKNNNFPTSPGNNMFLL